MLEEIDLQLDNMPLLSSSKGVKKRRSSSSRSSKGNKRKSGDVDDIENAENQENQPLLQTNASSSSSDANAGFIPTPSKKLRYKDAVISSTPIATSSSAATPGSSALSFSATAPAGLGLVRVTRSSASSNNNISNNGNSTSSRLPPTHAGSASRGGSARSGLPRYSQPSSRKKAPSAARRPSMEKIQRPPKNASSSSSSSSSVESNGAERRKGGGGKKSSTGSDSSTGSMGAAVNVAAAGALSSSKFASTISTFNSTLSSSSSANAVVATPMRTTGGGLRAIPGSAQSIDATMSGGGVGGGLTMSSNNNALLKRLRKNVTGNTAGEVIRKYFDTAFTIKEEGVSAIMAQMKVKSRWNYSERTKKMEAVIKELKQAILTTIAESKALRENCLMQESHTASLLRDVYDEFQELSHNLSAVKISDESLKIDILRLKEDLCNSSEALEQLRTEHAPLLQHTTGLEAQVGELSGKLLTEKQRREQAEHECESLRRDNDELKASAESALEELKKDQEKVRKESAEEVGEEIAALKAELEKKSAELMQGAQERAVLETKKAAMHEELLLLSSKLRESESSLARFERDVERLTSDLTRQREQTALKDADWRTTINAMNAMNDVQRQAMEEKNTLRSELLTCQGRLQQLEEERLSATVQLATKKEEALSAARDIQSNTEKIAELEARLVQRNAELAANKDALMMLEVEKELRARCEIREEAERTERIAAFAQLMAIQTESAAKVAEVEVSKASEIQRLAAEMAEVQKQRDAAREGEHARAEEVTGLKGEIQQLHIALENAANSTSANNEAVEQLGKVTGELEVLRQRMKEMSELQTRQVSIEASRLQEMEEKLRRGEVQRRKLHNLIQELRGNIRVFARVRPYLPSDGVDLNCPPDPTITPKVDANSMRICRAPRNAEDRGEDHTFTFDKVFCPSTSQEVVFNEVSEFVQSALDGYNVCLFSYGQTGSGKTHTMQGSGTGSMRGIIPRAMQQVGQYKNELQEKGWEYHMEVSFLEIYNETIRDLLRPVGQSAGEEAKGGKHEIKKDAHGQIYVTELTRVCVDPNNTEQVESIMENAARNRSVGQTAMNERSSRSHSVFALHLRASNASQGIVLNGTLSLVDLAGSERLDRSHATGSQLKETVAINKSLSALSDVFVAIGNKQSHVPFRNSKLTYLLQPALSGDGKTLMMVNLSPTEESFQESLCSLRLAKQVNQCELGKPKKQLKDASSASSSVTLSASGGLGSASSDSLGASLGSTTGSNGTANGASGIAAGVGSSKRAGTGASTPSGHLSRKVSRK